MKAGDVKCPKCGKGFRDVAQDVNVGLRDCGLLRMRSLETFGTCEQGHSLRVRATSEPQTFIVEALETT